MRNALNLYTVKSIKEAFFFYVFWLFVVFISTGILGFILSASEILNENNFYFLAQIVPTLIITLMVLKMYRNKSFSEPLLPVLLFLSAIVATYLLGYFLGLALISITTIFKSI